MDILYLSTFLNLMVMLLKLIIFLKVISYLLFEHRILYNLYNFSFNIKDQSLALVHLKNLLKRATLIKTKHNSYY